MSQGSGRDSHLGEYLLSLAEGLAALGQHEEALATLTRAIAWCEKTGERWCLPELLRVRGEFSRGDNAESWFRRAIALAAEQGALLWELRSALSLARLLAERGERAEAWRLLAAVHNRFSPAVKTADILAAELLLRNLRD
jgi:tetratricopeptide (TPR) repeat protein